MRWATLLVVATIATVACNDLRDFRGTWEGPRVGESPVLRVGLGDGAKLFVDRIDAHGIAGRLAVSGLIMPAAEFASVPGVEADALANLTFAGAPLRVYLAFVPIPDGAGDGTLVIALYDDDRIEVRLLRGGPRPLYAIFALAIAQGGS
ncbi:MAG: hypothetical protein KF773_08270 [Deltaproteobacteria bacterium]|nr:hypothetical protein [Deltaproteobacteria bacterium]MCW5806314.1 hypothetical protein [Deltaproteobacteria bacterium]